MTGSVSGPGIQRQTRSLRLDSGLGPSGRPGMTALDFKMTTEAKTAYRAPSRTM